MVKFIAASPNRKPERHRKPSAKGRNIVCVCVCVFFFPPRWFAFKGGANSWFPAMPLGFSTKPREGSGTRLGWKRIVVSPLVVCIFLGLHVEVGQPQAGRDQEVIPQTSIWGPLANPREGECKKSQPI